MQSLQTSEDKFVSNTSLRRTAMNRMLLADIPMEVVQKKTGRISDLADADYISTNMFEKRMSNSLYDATDSVSSTASNMTKINSVQKSSPDVEPNLERVMIPSANATEVYSNVVTSLEPVVREDNEVNGTKVVTKVEQVKEKNSESNDKQVFKFFYKSHDKEISFELPI